MRIHRVSVVKLINKFFTQTMFFNNISPSLPNRTCNLTINVCNYTPSYSILYIYRWAVSRGTLPAGLVLMCVLYIYVYWFVTHDKICTHMIAYAHEHMQYSSSSGEKVTIHYIVPVILKGRCHEIFVPDSCR